MVFRVDMRHYMSHMYAVAREGKQWRRLQASHKIPQTVLLDVCISMQNRSYSVIEADVEKVAKCTIEVIAKERTTHAQMQKRRLSLPVEPAVSITPIATDKSEGFEEIVAELQKLLELARSEKESEVQVAYEALKQQGKPLYFPISKKDFTLGERVFFHFALLTDTAEEAISCEKWGQAPASARVRSISRTQVEFLFETLRKMLLDAYPGMEQVKSSVPPSYLRYENTKDNTCSSVLKDRIGKCVNSLLSSTPLYYPDKVYGYELLHMASPAKILDYIMEVQESMQRVWLERRATRY